MDNGGNTIPLKNEATMFLATEVLFAAQRWWTARYWKETTRDDVVSLKIVACRNKNFNPALVEIPYFIIFDMSGWVINENKTDSFLHA